MGFLRNYGNAITGSWPGRLLLGIPTAIGVLGAVFGSGDRWKWAALILLGAALVQGYVAYLNYSPLRGAIGAVREEIEYIRRRLAELEADYAVASASTPNLPATDWNKQKDLLRQRLKPESYQVAFDFFDAVDRFNRERQNTLLEPDLYGLAQKLETADKALAAEMD